LDAASHSTLENEFGTHVDEEVIKQIIENGTMQEGDVSNHFNSSEKVNYLCSILLTCPRRLPNDKAQRTIAWVPAVVTKRFSSKISPTFSFSPSVGMKRLHLYQRRAMIDGSGREDIQRT
jgi:hypothetical protein